jgi:hypothetical protein
MPLISFICGTCGQYNSTNHITFDWEKCVHCGTLRSEKHASIHASERVVINYNPATGEVRIPGRADRPIHPKYAAEGYERRELPHLSDVRKLEKEKGLVHEASNYDGSGNDQRDTHSRSGFDRD